MRDRGIAVNNHVGCRTFWAPQALPDSKVSLIKALSRRKQIRFQVGGETSQALLSRSLGPGQSLKMFKIHWEPIPGPLLLTRVDMKEVWHMNRVGWPRKLQALPHWLDERSVAGKILNTKAERLTCP